MHHEGESDSLDAQQVEAILLGTPVRGVEASADAPVPWHRRRSCRICFDTDLPEGDRWIAPCRCKGTMKYVHASCLDEWRARSRRSNSSMSCDQCGTPYRMRATHCTRLVSSRWLRCAVTVLLFFVLTHLLGTIVHVALRRYEPAMFVGPHPVRLQSSSFEPDTVVPWIQTVADESSSMSLLWENMLAAFDDGDGESGDAELAASRDEMYKLGVFQPAILLQMVQGMTQRMLESAPLLLKRPRMLLGVPEFPRIVQRVVTSAHLRTNAPPFYATPLTWPELFFWQFTLGLALIGLSVHFHTFVIVSSIGAFHFGSPFLAVAVYPHAPQGLDGTVVWESRSIVGFFLLLLSVWGMGRTFVLVWGTLLRLSRWCLAHTPHMVDDYAEPAHHESRRGGGRIAPAGAPRLAWAAWLVERVVRGHAAVRDLDDARWVWMLAQAGD